MVSMPRGKSGLLPRPKTWQRGLELGLRDVRFNRHSREIFTGTRFKNEALGLRSEDFAEQYPEEALDTLVEVVRELARENDMDGAQHWQKLADRLGDWLAEPMRTSDPWDTEPEPKQRAKRTFPKALKPDDARKLLAAIDTRYPTGVRNLAMLTVIATAGLRIGEACALEPGSINWEERELTVEEGKTGPRVVPLPDGAALERMHETVAAWLRVRDEYWNIGTRCPYLFTTSKGKRVASQEPERFMKRYALKAGLNPDKVRPHALRHMYAKGVYGHCGNLRTVQELLGHKHLSTTMIYLEISKEEVKRDVEGFKVF